METFRSRVSNLVARTRKALRLYSNAGRTSVAGRTGAAGNYGDIQALQWRDITSDLLKDLTAAVQKNQAVKNLSADIFTIRDKFNSIWRSLEAEIHLKHRELINFTENGDYVKSALLGAELVSLKARYQASQAAHHELEELIKSCHYNVQPIVLSNQDVLEDRELKEEELMPESERSIANFSRKSFGLATGGKVIPIRKVL